MTQKCPECGRDLVSAPITGTGGCDHCGKQLPNYDETMSVDAAIAKNAGESLLTSADDLTEQFDSTADGNDRTTQFDPTANFTEQTAEIDRTTDVGDEPPFVTSPEASKTAGRKFGSYELLDEIARGGMGVVFRARQTRLNRVVALKMILSAQLATDESVRRFHAEAEAAAKLEHPGIVPIYEVGEIDGQHFFSMGLVEGGSLKDLVADGPLTGKRAAEVLKTIAEAVHYAHTRNIVHRDLKPANVLLDQDGQPKVTDFGLAKDTEADVGMTTTGQIMGTPGYMPPEQASGRIDEIGPLADVYSMGAILYFLLTRKPPFQGSSLMETLRRVTDEEPKSPAALNSAVDADLSTICLKCLEKDPARRYASSAELAEELSRYLEGRPIRARPVSQAERFQRWCRRNPLVATLAASAVALLVLGTCVSTYFAFEAGRRAKEEERQRGLATMAAEKAERERAAAEKAQQEAELAEQRADAQATEARNQRDAAKAALAETRKTINAYVDTVRNTQLLKEKRFKPLMNELLEDAVAHYERFVEHNKDDAGSRRDVALTYLDLGLTVGVRGDVQDAVTLLQKASDSFAGLLRENPEDIELLAEYVQTQSELIQLQKTLGKGKEAVQTFLEAEKVVDAVKQRSGSVDPSVAEPFAKASLATLVYSSSREEAVRTRAAKILESCEALLEADPDSAAYRSLRADVLTELSIRLRNFAPEDAKRYQEKSCDDYRTLLSENEDSYNYAIGLAKGLFILGDLSGRDDPAAQIPLTRQTIESFRKIARKHPNEQMPRLLLSSSLERLASYLEQQSVDEALKAVGESIEVASALVDEYPKVPLYEFMLSRAVILKGDIYNRTTKLGGKEIYRHLEGALENLVPLLSLIEQVNPTEEKTTFWRNSANYWLNKAKSQLSPTHPAVFAVTQAIRKPEEDKLRNRIENATNEDGLRMELARFLANQGRVSEAVDEAVRALDAGHPKLLPGKVSLKDAQTRLLLVLANRRLGDEKTAKANGAPMHKMFSFDVNYQGTLPLMFAVVNSELQQNPNDASLLTTRARLHARLQQFDAAFDDVMAVSQLSKTPDQVRTKLIASIARDFGDLERSVDLFSKLIERDPTNVDLRRSRGELRARLGRWHEAVEDYALFVPESRHAWEREHLALLTKAAKLHKTYRVVCRQMVDEFLARDDKNKDPAGALIAATLGNSGVPLQLLEQLYTDEVGERKPQVQLTANAMFAYRTRKYEQALEICQRQEIAEGPLYAISCLFLKSLALSRLKRPQEAREAWQKGADTFNLYPIEQIAWWDRIRCELLRDEAASLLPPKLDS